MRLCTEPRLCIELSMSASEPRCAHESFPSSLRCRCDMLQNSAACDARPMRAPRRVVEILARAAHFARCECPLAAHNCRQDSFMLSLLAWRLSSSKSCSHLAPVSLSCSSSVAEAALQTVCRFATAVSFPRPVRTKAASPGLPPFGFTRSSRLLLGLSCGILFEPRDHFLVADDIIGVGVE